MPYYDEVFKHVTGEFPYELAALALNTSEVEVGDRLGTDQATVRMHHSDMTFHVRLPDKVRRFWMPLRLACCLSQP